MMSNKYCVISIDVEPDSSINWQYSNPITFKGVDVGVRQVLHPLFVKHKVSPTYLINNVVLEDQHSVEVFSTLPYSYELGTHLHPEFIQPLKTVDFYGGSKGVANCIDYPPSTEHEKIKSITHLFKECFGYCPVSYRGGRFSARPSTLKSLRSLGYLVDSSVTPYVLWDDSTRKSILDYREAIKQPAYTPNFMVSSNDSKNHIFEVPISIVPTNRLPLPKRLLNPRLLRTKNIWLRPSSTSFKELKALVDYYENRFIHNGFLTLNMMFHNVEVLPYNSPYSATQAQTKAILFRLERFIDYLKYKGYHFVTLKQLESIYRVKHCS